MRRVSGPVAIVAAVFLAPPPAGPRAQEQRPTFRAGVTAVAVDVSVRVRNNPVPGLGPRDFELTDHGVPQRIDSVSIEPIPLDVSILLDVSGSSYGWVRQLEQNAAELAAILTPADRFRVICFGLEVREVVPMQAPGEVVRLGSIPYAGGTSLYDALFHGIVHDSGPDRRHLIVTFTDGSDTTSVLSADQVVDAATRSDASVHMVQLRANSGNPPLIPLWSDSGVGRPVPEELERIVEATGGRVHIPIRPFRPSLPEEMREVLADYRTRYVLRFVPAGVSPDGWHSLTVTVPRQPRARIEARRGYFAGPPRQPKEMRPKPGPRP